MVVDVGRLGAQPGGRRQWHGDEEHEEHEGHDRNEAPCSHFATSCLSATLLAHPFAYTVAVIWRDVAVPTTQGRRHRRQLSANCFVLLPSLLFFTFVIIIRNVVFN